MCIVGTRERERFGGAIKSQQKKNKSKYLLILYEPFTREPKIKSMFSII
jgi:hypothetical protein